MDRSICSGTHEAASGGCLDPIELSDQALELSQKLQAGPVDLREVRRRPGFHTYVVLDTNILIKDWFLAGAGFSALKAACSLINAQLVVPELVLDELLTNYSEAVGKAVAAMAQVSQGSRDLAKTKEEKVSIYGKFLEQQRESGAIIAIPYPQVSHREVVQRMYERRRPFHGGETGYKDFLIGRSIVELLQDNGDWDLTRAVLISANTGDFAESGKDKSHYLHSDYLRDLVPSDRERARVVYHSAIDSYSRSILGDGFAELTRMHPNAARELWQEALPSILNKFLFDRRPGRQWITYRPDQIEFTMSHVRKISDDAFTISGVLDFNPWWYDKEDGRIEGDNLWEADVSLLVNRHLIVSKADIDGESVLV